MVSKSALVKHFYRAICKTCECNVELGLTLKAEGVADTEFGDNYFCVEVGINVLKLFEAIFGEVF